MALLRIFRTLNEKPGCTWIDKTAVFLLREDFISFEALDLDVSYTFGIFDIFPIYDSKITRPSTTAP